jgi:hypothetical protein
MGGVSEYDHEASITRRPWPTRGAIKKRGRERERERRKKKKERKMASSDSIKTKFCIFLTVHLRVILVGNQLDAQFFI